MAFLDLLELFDNSNSSKTEFKDIVIAAAKLIFIPLLFVVVFAITVEVLTWLWIKIFVEEALFPKLVALVLCLLFVGLCVRSYITARKARGVAAQTEDVSPRETVSHNE